MDIIGRGETFSVHGFQVSPQEAGTPECLPVSNFSWNPTTVKESQLFSQSEYDGFVDIMVNIPPVRFAAANWFFRTDFGETIVFSVIILQKSKNCAKITETGVMLEILNVFTSGALPAERTPRALPAGRTPRALPAGRILNQDDRADIVYDITPWLDTKIAAALCHKTQHAMFLRNSRAPTIADMAWKTETFHIWKGPLPKGLRNRGQS